MLLCLLGDIIDTYLMKRQRRFGERVSDWRSFLLCGRITLGISLLSDLLSALARDSRMSRAIIFVLT